MTSYVCCLINDLLQAVICYFFEKGRI